MTAQAPIPAIEDGIVELDGELRERIRSLKTERDIAQTSLDRIATQARAGATINLERLNNFSRLMREKLDTGDTQARSRNRCADRPLLRPR
jgi:hypothetical protein